MTAPRSAHDHGPPPGREGDRPDPDDAPDIAPDIAPDSAPATTGRPDDDASLETTMKIYNVDRGGRTGAIAALVGVPVLFAAAAVARYAGDVRWALSPGLAAPAVLYLLGVRALWTSLHTWVEVTADGITWSTPATSNENKPAKTRGKSTRHLSPSGTVAADRIAAIAVTPFTRTSAPAQDRAGAASFAVVVHLMDGGRVVLPVTSPPAPVSRAMDRLLEALAHLPGVPPIDISPLAGIPRARTSEARDRRKPTSQ